MLRAKSPQHRIAQPPQHQLRVAHLDLDARLQPYEISPALRPSARRREPASRVPQDLLDGPPSDTELNAPTIRKPIAFTLGHEQCVRPSIGHREPNDDEARVVANLHFSPRGGRQPGRICRALVFRNQPLVAAGLNRRPGREPILVEMARGIDEPIGAGHDVLKGLPAITQRTLAEIASAELEAVEGHEHGRRRQLAARIAEQMEPAHEVPIEDADLAVEDERPRRNAPRWRWRPSTRAGL